MIRLNALKSVGCNISESFAWFTVDLNHIFCLGVSRPVDLHNKRGDFLLQINIITLLPLYIFELTFSPHAHFQIRVLLFTQQTAPRYKHFQFVLTLYQVASRYEAKQSVQQRCGNRRKRTNCDAEKRKCNSFSRPACKRTFLCNNEREWRRDTLH